MKLLFSKTVCHHFWPGLLAGAQPVRHSLAELTPGIEFFLGWYIGICMGLNSMVSIELGSDQYLIQTSSEVI